MQIVGYETSPSPALRVANGERIERISLEPGEQLAYTLGQRHCAGTVSEKGNHIPCEADAAPYCDTHTVRWACARCTGDCDLPLPACREEHAVYLAAFAPDRWKVGVTRSWRLETRLREQGADRGAHIRTVDTGRRARQIEAGIADSVPDRVQTASKIAGLHRAVETDAWQSFLEKYDPIERYEFDYGLDLDRQPVADTAAAGEVIGSQGRVTVLAVDQAVFAVDLRDLVGFELIEETPERAAQSNLDAF